MFSPSKTHSFAIKIADMRRSVVFYLLKPVKPAFLLCSCPAGRKTPFKIPDERQGDEAQYKGENKLFDICR